MKGKERGKNKKEKRNKKKILLTVVCLNNT